MTNLQGCSGVATRGNAFPHLFAPGTLPEDLDFSFHFLRVAPRAT